MIDIKLEGLDKTQLVSWIQVPNFCFLNKEP